MPGIPFRIAGRVFEDNKRKTLLLSRTGPRCILRLGFVIRGSEETFLPETLLDDWGHEIGGIDLYHWVRDNAFYFPRAELFGFDLKGRPRQYFVRDLDLAAKYRCYVYENPGMSIEAGAEVEVILVPVEADRPGKQQGAPQMISFPLSEATVEWWTVDREQL